MHANGTASLLKTIIINLYILNEINNVFTIIMVFIQTAVRA